MRLCERGVAFGAPISRGSEVVAAVLAEAGELGAEVGTDGGDEDEGFEEEDDRDGAEGAEDGAEDPEGEGEFYFVVKCEEWIEGASGGKEEIGDKGEPDFEVKEGFPPEALEDEAAFFGSEGGEFGEGAVGPVGGHGTIVRGGMVGCKDGRYHSEFNLRSKN